MANDDFIRDYTDLAVTVAQRTGIAPEVVLAQAAHESRWGKSGLTKDANNFFGVKGRYEGNAVPMLTREVRNGQSVMERANFRSYPSPDEAFLDYARLMNRGIYEPVRKAGTIQEQIRQIALGPYSTEFSKAYSSALAKNVSLIQNSPAFQEAFKAATDAIALDQIGIPDLPSALLGLEGEQIETPPDDGLPVPDLPPDLIGLDAFGPAPPAGFSIGRRQSSVFWLSPSTLLLRTNESRAGLKHTPIHAQRCAQFSRHARLLSSFTGVSSLERIGSACVMLLWDEEERCSATHNVPCWSP